MRSVARFEPPKREMQEECADRRRDVVFGCNFSFGGSGYRRQSERTRNVKILK
jgi:hypothetical protein